MPVGVRFVKTDKVVLSSSKGDKNAFTQQLNIWDNEEHIEESVIENLGDSAYGDYTSYSIKYYDVKRVDGLFKGDRVNELLIDEEKKFYIPSEGNYLLVKASKRDTKRIMKLLNHSNLVSAEFATIDLKELLVRMHRDRSHYVSIEGAWITDLECDKLNTAGYFGVDVDESDDLNTYLAQQTSTVTMIKVNLGDETIGITNELGVVLYGRRVEEEILEGYEVMIQFLEKYQMFEY